MFLTRCLLLNIALLLNFDKNWAHLNNVCTTYEGYFSIITNKNCYYSPSLFQSVPNIVETYIGNCEIHNVTTEDGYILTTFRIPQKNPKGVILFYHPIFTDSSIWVSQDNASIAFVFHRAGYDVWLANSRGTRYSQKHLILTVADKKFWDFSFYEIGYYDQKAVIDDINAKTGSSIILLGHSMGTTSSLIYSSLRPEESQSSLKVIISMAPIAHLQYFSSPIMRIVSTYIVIPLLEPLNMLLRQYSIAANYNSLLWQTFRRIANAFPAKYLYSLITSFLSGWTPHQFDPTFFNIIYSEYPSGFSWKTIYHYCQIIRANGRFRNYDYGTEINLKKYGQKTPLEFPVENITTPLYLVYSSNDSISYPKDVELLYDRLNPIAKPYGKMEIYGFNHADFHYGKDRLTKLYQPLLEFLNNKF